jgi:hypothetical protein
MAEGASMKPGDFLIGVLDVFAVLLPGVTAAWLVVQYVPRSALHDALLFGFETSGEPNEWVVGGAFFLTSYVLGHFVFMLGSKLDTSYDHWRTRTKPASRDKAYAAAKALRAGVTEELVDGDWSMLQWARAYIQVKAQHARVEIDRLEVDQKFFRSLVIIAVAFAAHFFLHEATPVAGVVAVVGGLVSYQRYREQRWKMTELIYGTAVIVSKTGTSGPSPAPGAGE